MLAVKKIRKEAGKGHLVITPRKKGEHVPRKLFLRDGTRLDVLIEERPVQNVHVEKVVTEWKESTNPHANVFHAKPLYLRAEAYLPGNHDVRLAIVDQNDIRFINGCGEQRLCLVKMPASTLRKLPNSDVWMIGDKYKSTVYRVEPSVALGKFFAQNDWSKLVRLWLTENLDKDPRLMEAFKTTVIPFIPQNWKVDSELSKLMFYQNHQFWITNSKSGKSEYPRLVGEIPSNEWTSSGLWGGTVGEERVYGVLEGYGLHFFDEVMYIRNVNSETLLPQLLSYLQQGTASRSLKSRIDCRGTKAVIFASNPTNSSDMLSSVVDFIKVVAGIEFPEKVGSRIGMLLVGNDFRTVAPGGNISDYRDVVHRVVMQLVQKYYFSRIYPILKMNMEWADSVDEIKNTYEAFSVACPHETVKQFIHGMGLAIPKLKMGVIRSLMLEHLDKLVLSSDLKAFQRNVIEKEREQRLSMLVDINLQSFGKVSAALEKLEPTRECAVKLRAKFPNMGTRAIALLMGDISKTTVAEWLKEEMCKEEKDGKIDGSSS